MRNSACNGKRSCLEDADCPMRDAILRFLEKRRFHSAVIQTKLFAQISEE